VTGLRERKKQQTREALEAVAMRLFERKGFDVTTVEEIAAAANVSPRTVFRYFPTKHDLVFSRLHDRLELLLAAVRRRPPDEPPLVAACAAAIEANAGVDEGLMEHATGLLAANRSLRTYGLELRERWQTELAAELAVRDRQREPTPLHRFAGEIAVGAMECALQLWHERGAKPGAIRPTTEEVVGLVWQLTDAPSPVRAARSRRAG
jgi:AcrR family transcriptional regulator